MYLASNEVLTFCFYITLSVQLFPVENQSTAKIASSCIKIVIAGLLLNIVASVASLFKAIYAKIKKLWLGDKAISRVHNDETGIYLGTQKNKVIITDEYD